MKCFILAGGDSDRLWPLSRREYPKQFMEIREHRSMFQETVLRNIPFSEEYIIIANRKYEDVIKGQLRAFSKLKYSFVFEEEAYGTALPVTMALLYSRESEEILIASTDSVLVGEYNATVMSLKGALYSGKVGIVATEEERNASGYNFVHLSDGKIESLGTERKREEDLWDCGIVMGRASGILDAMDPEWVEFCRGMLGLYSGVVTKEMSVRAGLKRLNQVLRPDRLELVRATFSYFRIVDLQSYNDFITRSGRAVVPLREKSEGAEVINTEENKTIVLNDVGDITVVNTPDALYLSQKEDVAEIKDIIHRNYGKNPDVFDRSSTEYFYWGVRTVIYKTSGYRVTKLRIYPGMELSALGHKQHTETYSVISGRAKITIGKTSAVYGKDQSAYCPIGKPRRLENVDDSDLIILETRLGSNLMEDEVMPSAESFVKLTPYLRNCIWGGTRLKTLGKKLNGQKDIGESWELSTHPAGESVVAEGKYAGKTLQQYIDIIGKDKLGWKAQAFSRFPILIKFIDAHDSLSIQVHPDDEYAFPHENEYGKNEMWYIVAASQGAFIYAGFKRDVTREEVARRVKDKTLEEVLCKIPVEAGQTYFLHAGTVHAIGKGCLICEIQQSSNVTYRLYDYDKVDKNGNKRELHVDKALDVLNFKAVTRNVAQHERRFFSYRNGLKEILGDCKYFTAVRYEANRVLTISVDYSSFLALVVLEGSGKVNVGNESESMFFKRGETFFGVAKEYTFRSLGKISVIAVTL